MAQKDSRRSDAGTDGVLTQVCMQCGNEYSFAETEPPERMTCEKCGGHVFRSFFDAVREGEAEADFRETTERDVTTDGDAGEVTRGDVLDLNNI